MADDPATLRWQRKLLPVMVTALGLLSLYFIVVSTIQFRWLQDHIADEHSATMAGILADLAPTNASPAQVQTHQFHVLTSLDLYALDRRYHQANMMLMSRAWTRYMGFVTGMVLSLIGAAFVLGKIRDPGTRVEGGRDARRWVSFESASPGLVMGFFGLILMVVAMMVQVTMDMTDAPLFTATWSGRATNAPVVGAPDQKKHDALILNAKP